MKQFWFSPETVAPYKIFMCPINFAVKETGSNTFLMAVIIRMVSWYCFLNVLFINLFCKTKCHISYVNITFSSKKQLQLYKISPNDLSVL